MPELLLVLLSRYVQSMSMQLNLASNSTQYLTYRYTMALLCLPGTKTACHWAPFQVLQGDMLHLRDGFDWLQRGSNGAVHQRRRWVYRLVLHGQGLLNLDASRPCILVLVQYSTIENRLVHRICWLSTLLYT
ncbi:hypothetical protein J3F84DRAFT_197962 [Trichoderma pleuroticola]